MQPIVMPAVSAFSTFSTRISRSTVLLLASRGLRPGERARPRAARLPGTTRRLYLVRAECETAGSGRAERAGRGDRPAVDRYKLRVSEPPASDTRRRIRLAAFGSDGSP